MGNRRMRVAIARAAKVLGMKWRPRRDDESIPDDLITVDEAAKRYGLSAQTVRNRFDSYEWLGRRANGGMGPRLFRASTIDAILADADDDADEDVEENDERPSE